MVRLGQHGSCVCVCEQLRLKERLADADARATKWRELAERASVFANEAKERFEKGALGEKREILVALGSNLKNLAYVRTKPAAVSPVVDR